VLSGIVGVQLAENGEKRHYSSSRTSVFSLPHYISSWYSNSH